jgi:hypothetical protein
MELQPPLLGIDKSGAAAKQPALTSPDMNNVRPIDSLEGRTRMGQRPGLDKWGAGTQIGGVEQPVVCMCLVRSAN